MIVTLQLSAQYTKLNSTEKILNQISKKVVSKQVNTYFVQPISGNKRSTLLFEKTLLLFVPYVFLQRQMKAYKYWNGGTESYELIASDSIICVPCDNTLSSQNVWSKSFMKLIKLPTIR